MKTIETEAKIAQAKPKTALSPELLELVHMLDALEAGFHERMLAARM